jgi:hypothetical protein
LKSVSFLSFKCVSTTHRLAVGVERKFTDVDTLDHTILSVNIGARHIAHVPPRLLLERVNGESGFGFWSHGFPRASHSRRLKTIELFAFTTKFHYKKFLKTAYSKHKKLSFL